MEVCPLFCVVHVSWEPGLTGNDGERGFRSERRLAGHSPEPARKEDTEPSKREGGTPGRRMQCLPLTAPPSLFLSFQLCALDFHCLEPLGSPLLLFLIFLSFVWFILLDFLTILIDFIDFPIDVHCDFPATVYCDFPATCSIDVHCVFLICPQTVLALKGFLLVL